MFCSRCGSAVPSDARHCTACGHSLRTSAPADTPLSDLEQVRAALAAEYDVRGELGRGGMAIVYRARETALEREVAIKVLPTVLAFDAEFVERFQREARTAAGLEHPHIIPVYRVGRAGPVTYFVMKYLRGGSLSDLLGRRGRLAPPEVRRLLIDTAAALGHAARRSVVHRDVKPDNILFDEGGSPTVTDFGIAKAAQGQRLTSTGMSIGTPHYMSPEQARAQGTDGRSDLYSLGVVGYQCLTGRVPFDGPDAYAIGLQHITDPLPEPLLGDPDERRVFAIIRRLLAKEPGDRFADADALVQALSGGAVAPVQLEGERREPLYLPRDASQPVNPAAPTTPASAIALGMRTPRRVMTPGSGRRPVARRPDSRRRSRAPWVLVAVLLLTAAGGWYYARYRTLDPRAALRPHAPAPATDSLPAVDAAATDDRTATAPLMDTVPSPPVRRAPSAAATVAPAGPSVPAAPPDSGALRVVGVPRGTTVLLDGRPVLTAVTRLRTGRHVLAISAPRHQFWTDTVTIVVDEVLEVRPELTPFGAPRRPNRRATP